MGSKKPFDLALFLCILLLLMVGIVFVFSSSFYFTMSKYDDKFMFLRKDLLFTVIGLIVMFVFSNIPYRKLQKFAPMAMVVSLILLVVVLTPLGTKLNGARRWLDLGFTTFMPSELARVASIVFFSASLARIGNRIKDFTNGLMFYLGTIGLLVGLIMLQPNMSTAVAIALTLVTILFVAGMRWIHMVLLGVPSIMMGMVLILTSDYRSKRFFSFLNPFKDALGDGYQVVQSLYALGSGGTFGVGLGHSAMNKLYIPEPMNDFIFATIGEEFGFVGTALLLLLFTVLIYRGTKIAMNCEDRFGCYLATGITAMVAIQFIINIGVGTSLIPPTGIPLPFISYGGTNLVFLLMSMGILLNISKEQTAS